MPQICVRCPRVRRFPERGLRRAHRQSQHATAAAGHRPVGLGGGLWLLLLLVLYSLILLMFRALLMLLFIVN